MDQSVSVKVLFHPGHLEVEPGELGQWLEIPRYLTTGGVAVVQG